MIELSGWGLYPVLKSHKISPNNLIELKNAVISSSSIARGNGRSYGDSAIGVLNTIDMLNFNRFLSFNENNGLLVAQAGLMLKDIIEVFLPKGWFPPVTPGTKFLTLGGMVAANVHGKNHHQEGSFLNFIKWIEIMNNKGEIVRCSREENRELFLWTVGGMGLTGIILNVAFFLKSVETNLIKQRTLVANNIFKVFELFEKNIESSYSVAWIDCYSKGQNLGRSLLMLGEHATKDDIKYNSKLIPFKNFKKRKISIPTYFPAFFLNLLTVKIFNNFYFLKGKFSKKNIFVDLDTFFYPLDKILNWNKFYGKRGFAQFQCVIPLSNSVEGISELLKCISKSNSSSFLAVLKRFGKDKSEFSFPMEGYSLSLDFPINKNNLLLMNQLDNITVKYGGRFYLAKDSRIKKNIFDRSDKRIKNFKAYRDKNLKKSFNSFQSKRLGL